MYKTFLTLVFGGAVALMAYDAQAFPSAAQDSTKVAVGRHSGRRRLWARLASWSGWRLPSERGRRSPGTALLLARHAKGSGSRLSLIDDSRDFASTKIQDASEKRSRNSDASSAGHFFRLALERACRDAARAHGYELIKTLSKRLTLFLNDIATESTRLPLY